MAVDVEHWRSVITEVLDRSANLSRGTTDFLDSVFSFAEDKQHLTEMQIVRIKQIADENGVDT